MSNDLNMHIASGRLGADPEQKYLSSGTPVVNLSIASNRGYKDKQGEWQQETQWFNVVVWGEKTCAYVMNNLHKGDYVYVTGTGSIRAWDSDQGKKWFYEIVVRPFNGTIERLLKSPDQQSRPRTGTQPRPAGDIASESFQKPASSNDFDDDIPF